VTWTIQYSREAERAVAALDPVVRRRVLAAIGGLARDPYASPNVKALHGGNFRLRVGDWRVIYTLHSGVLVVLVLRVASRGKAYR
jgi:mRNA interferase RelE/StbE